MRNKKRKKLNKRAIISKLVILVSVFVIAFGIILLSSDSIFLNVNAEADYEVKTGSYKGTQKHIVTPNTSANTSQSTYITMTDAAESNSAITQTISISTPEELILFSNICATDGKEAFLGYHYVLTENITIIYQTNEYKFKPIGYKGTPFTGEFDGQGYEIKNLFMQFISDSDFESINYFSMFSENSGNIHDLGLVGPKLTTTRSLPFNAEGIGGVSYLVGGNSGSVVRCFVVDDGNALKEEAGISSTGDNRVSTLIVDNKSGGTLSNCYVAIDSILNIKNQDPTTFAEIACSNSGAVDAISDCFFYNNSIAEYEGDSSHATAKYKDSYGFIDNDYTPYGTRRLSANDLATKLPVGWYTAADYGIYEANIGIKYGLTRGVDMDYEEVSLTSDTFDPSKTTYYKGNEHTLVASDESFDGSATYYTKSIIKITNPKDFQYMYELFNSSDFMASNKATYKITTNINLSGLKASLYTYKKVIGAKFVGAEMNSTTNNPVLSNNTKTLYPTIYNADILNSSRIQTQTGVDCYGLFNYFAGTIENLNFVSEGCDLNDIKTSASVKGIGVVSGYTESGTINNVNVYATFTNSTTTTMGEYYLGGITGILGDGTISNSTVAGSMNIENANTASVGSGYMGGVAIGGVVGYIEESLGSIYTCLNAMDITTSLGSDITYAIGGVVGAGYTEDYNETTFSGNLENTGNIVVSGTYNELYVSGVFARHLGMTGQIHGLTNNGNVTVTPESNKLTYVSGVSNTEINNKSQLIDNEGVRLYFASGFANGGNVTINGSCSNLYYTNVLNINNNVNGFKSYVSGLYNLAYYEKYNLSADKVRTYQNAQSININDITKFAPVLNINNNTGINASTFLTQATHLYNLRDIAFSQSGDVTTSSLEYCGVSYGKYVNYEDIRNEGNLLFTFNKRTELTSSLIISGLFDEVSSGFKSNNLYNGGNINVNYSHLFFGNIIASGICHANKNGFDQTEIRKYNPASDTFDNTLVGSINNAINAGEIIVDNPTELSRTTGSYTVIKSANNQSDLGSVYEIKHFCDNINIVKKTYTYNESEKFLYKLDTTGFDVNSNMNGYYKMVSVSGEAQANTTYYTRSTSGSNYKFETFAVTINTSDLSKNTDVDGKYTWEQIESEEFYDSNTQYFYEDYFVTLYGDIFNSGIVYDNESVITNTFNIGDISSYNYIIKFGSDEYEVNSSGIVGLNVGQFAYILNCGNNGTIKAYNGSLGNDMSDVSKSNVNASGIVCRNDENVNGTSYSSNTSNPNSSQVISFTINYGDIFAYNYRTNIQTTAYEPSCKAAGIIAMGLLNTINVLNYGNVFGSEAASGIFGVMYFAKYVTEVASSKVYIANTINYGNVYMLSRGYNYAHGSSYLDQKIIAYSRFKALTNSNIVLSNNTKGNIEAFTEVIRNSNYISPIGSVFSLANYATSPNSSNITVRYLISFNENVGIVGATVSAPTDADIDASTLYSAHISINAKSGAYLNDTWISEYVQYSPLSTTSFTGRFVTDINSYGNITTGNETYQGVFSSNFEFRKTVDGKNTLNLVDNPTDAYISDYFQFVGYKYINPILFEKIGWQKLAYSSAVNDFAISISKVADAIEKSNNYISSLQTNAKNTTTWMHNLVANDLITLINVLAEEENSSDLLSVLGYIYSNDSQSNIYIDSSVREAVLENLISNNNEYLSLLNTILKYENGYSKTLAELIDINQEAVVKKINEYINDIYDNSSSDLLSILDSYINYLELNNNNYFNYRSNETKRIDMLTTLFENINDSAFYRELVSILGISDSSISDETKMYYGYESLNDSQKVSLFTTIVEYNYDKIDSYLNVMSSDINFYSRLVESGYNATSIDGIYSNSDITSGSRSDSASVIDNRVALWNQIKNTNIFRNYFNNLVVIDNSHKLYFKATEYNNTYQSITEPHNEGAYVGETSERLSYMYTLEITPQVYFYGPYTDNTGSTTFASSITNGTNEVARKLNDPVVNAVEINRGWNGNSWVNKKLSENAYGYDERYLSIFHYSDSSLWNSNELMLSRGGNNSTTTFKDALTPTGNKGEITDISSYVPKLIYYDSNNEQLGGPNATCTLDKSYYVSGDYYNLIDNGGFSFKGFTTSGETQLGNGKTFPDPLTGKTNNSASDWSGTLFKTSNLYMRVSATGETFSLSNATMGPRLTAGGNVDVTLSDGQTKVKLKNRRCYIQDENGAYHLVQAGSSDTIQIGTLDENGNFSAKHVLKDFDSKSDNIFSFLAYELAKPMYTSTVSLSYHSTGRTGIYRHRGGWDNYFTWKQNNKTRVFTSQYIDYNHNDLYNLDGYLTQFEDGKSAYSDDERYIINYLFNTYFLTSSNIDEFKEVVNAALLESLGDSISKIDFVKNFFETNIYSSKLIDSSVPFVYLNESSNNTVKAFLTGRQSIGADNKKLLIYGSSGNREKYAKLLKILRTVEEIPSNDNYQYYERLLTYLAEHPGHINNDNIVLSNLSSMSIIELANYLSAFDITDDVTINSLYDLTSKMSSYHGVVTKSQSTYDSVNYEYGFKFTSMTLTPASTDTRIIMIAKSTGASSTLTKGTDTGTITAIGEYYFETNGSTSVTITSDSDVIVYAIYFVQDNSYTNQQTTLNGTVLGNNNSKHFNITKSEIEAQIDTAITNTIGNNKYYRVTSYSATANITITCNASATTVYLALAASVPSTSDCIANKSCDQGDNTLDLALIDAYYGEDIYAVQWNQRDNVVTYEASQYRYISAVSYTITYSYIANGAAGTTNKTATSLTVNLYDTNVITGQTYTSNVINVNENSVTLPTKANLQATIASAISANANDIVVTGIAATFTLYHNYEGSYNVYIFDSNGTELGASSTTVSAYTNTDIIINNLTSYYGQIVNGKTYSNSYAATIVSYTYTVTYKIDPNTVNTTLPTLDNVKALATSDSGIANPTITASSITITARNRLGSAYNLYLYDNSANSVIGDFGSVVANETASVTINLANYYGKTVSVRFYSSGYYTESNRSFIFDSYNYTVTYQAPNYSIPYNTVYKNRLLNLSLKYSETQNKYFSYITKNSTNYADKYEDFVKANVLNFAAINTSGNDNNPTNPLIDSLSNADKIEFAELLAKNSNIALYSVISYLYNNASSDEKTQIVKKALSAMARTSKGYAYIADAFVDLEDNDLIDSKAKVLKYLIAAYIVADYKTNIYNGNTAYDTEFRLLVDNVNTNATGKTSDNKNFSGNINFINSDGTFDATKYDYFIEYLYGVSSSNSDDSFGIYALSSSHGKLNGEFIPDNLNLDNLDSYYTIAGYTVLPNGSVYVAGKEYYSKSGNNYNRVTNITIGNSANGKYELRYELCDEPDALWRGGEESVADTYSVNYAFYKEMKQLVKSISTVIFELDITNSGNTYYGDIDIDNNTITYYYTGSPISSGNISLIDLAYGAKAYKGAITSPNGELIDIENSSNLAISSGNTITVFAEDTTVYKQYKVQFKELSTTLALSYSDGTYTKTIAANASDTTITLTLTSSNVKLREGFNLEPYIRFVTTNGDVVTYDMTSEYLEISSSSNDHRIDSNGNATITIVVSKRLPADTYNIVVDICGNQSNSDPDSDPVTLKKVASTESAIISGTLDGNPVTFTSYAASSEILFGRAYDYTDLTDPESPNFYLYNFAISNNATAEISATKEISSSGLMKYVVTYKITAEDGEHTSTYVHTLTEKVQFDSNFASGLYQDGSPLANSLVYNSGDDNFIANEYKLTTDTKFVSGKAYYTRSGAGTTESPYVYEIDTTVTADDDITSDTYYEVTGGKWSFTDGMKVHVEFNRGSAPQYRIKYILDNFYNMASTVRYSEVITPGSIEANAAVSTTYAGLFVTVTDGCDTGTYRFVYSYSNYGTWSDGNRYYRYYEFPELEITKLPSTDALLKKLTFLEESIVFGNTATVIMPETVLIPDDSGAASSYDVTDKIYQDVFEGKVTREIAVTSTGIQYTGDSGIYNGTTINNDDYYAIGTVSEADLSFYGPGFAIPDYSQIYQYTTLEKLIHYGASKQIKTYVETSDSQFVEGKSYYTRTGEDPNYEYSLATVTAGDTVTADTYYEIGTYYKDSEILGDHNDIFLYVPFEKESDHTTVVFLVKLDSNYRWKAVYTTDYDGKDESKKIYTYTSEITSLSVRNDITNRSNVMEEAASFAYDEENYYVNVNCGTIGEDGDNKSLYMDYIGTPLDGHFWYVSYLVFSEEALHDGHTLGNIRFYHISIIDMTNNIQFYVTVYAPTELNLDTIFLTISENVDGSVNKKLTEKVTYSISSYVQYDSVYDGGRSEISGYRKYELVFNLQALPRGYFYFYIDLPGGYRAITHTIGMRNQNDDFADSTKEDHYGAFLPASSILTQKVYLEYIVGKGLNSDSDVWAITTSDIYTYQAGYEGNI